MPWTVLAAGAGGLVLLFIVLVLRRRRRRVRGPGGMEWRSSGCGRTGPDGLPVVD